MHIALHHCYHMHIPFIKLHIALHHCYQMHIPFIKPLVSINWSHLAPSKDGGHISVPFQANWKDTLAMQGCCILVEDK